MMIMMMTWFDETICMYMLWLHLYVYDMLEIIVKAQNKIQQHKMWSRFFSSETNNSSAGYGFSSSEVLAVALFVLGRYSY